MINGAHVIIYSTDAEADREFFKDVLGLAHVDVGDGWLIFGLPPSEVAVHPAGGGMHEGAEDEEASEINGNGNGHGGANDGEEEMEAGAEEEEATSFGAEEDEDLGAGEEAEEEEELESEENGGAGGGGHHELYLMCDDIEAFVSQVGARSLECSPVQDQGWGLLTQVTLPGGGKLGVYQPRHARPPTAEPAGGGARKASGKKASARASAKRPAKKAVKAAKAAKPAKAAKKVAKPAAKKKGPKKGRR
jgi:hypothetical protein